MDAALPGARAMPRRPAAPPGRASPARAAVSAAAHTGPETLAPLPVREPLLVRLLRQRGYAVLQRRRQVRAGATADSIHDLRVATRRLQELLDLYEPVLPGKESRKVWTRARRIRRDLADVRDADILADLVADLAGQAMPEERPALLALERRLMLQAGRLRGVRAGPRHEGLRVKGFRKRLRGLLDALRPVTLQDLARAGNTGLRERDRALWAALRKASSGRADDLHGLRIAVKRWRYSLEILQASGLQRCPKAIRAARQLQTSLGSLHDLDVLIHLVATDPLARPLLTGLRRGRRRRVLALQEGLAAFRAAALAEGRRA
jgi:CHAD domain-containing protein